MASDGAECKTESDGPCNGDWLSKVEKRVREWWNCYWAYRIALTVLVLLFGGRISWEVFCGFADFLCTAGLRRPRIRLRDWLPRLCRLTIVAGVVAVIIPAWRVLAAASPDAAGYITAILLWLCTPVGLIHLLALRRLAASGDARLLDPKFTDAGDAIPRPLSHKPLPSQKDVVERMAELIEQLTAPSGSGKHPSHGVVIPLEGRWGTGKTFVLELLEHHLKRTASEKAKEKRQQPQDGPGWIVLDINVWRLENSRHLLYHIYRRLLSSDYMLRHFRRRVPLRYSFASALRLLGTLGAKIGLKLGNGSVELEPVAPVDWQEDFEIACAFARSRGKRVLLLLDETERADTWTVQATMTLTCRALQKIPGLATVFSYVPDRLRYKAFSPYTVRMEDLRAHIYGLIYDYVTDPMPPRRARSLRELWKDNCLGERHTDLWVWPSDLLKDGEGKLQSWQTGGKGGADGGKSHCDAETLCTSEREVEALLLAAYEKLDVHSRALLTSRFTEKYISEPVFEVKDLTLKDMLYLTVLQLEDLFEDTQVDRALWDRFFQTGVLGLLQSKQQEPAQRPPSIRALIRHIRMTAERVRAPGYPSMSGVSNEAARTRRFAFVCVVAVQNAIYESAN